jgi:AraC-like DNA-binding protein
VASTDRRNVDWAKLSRPDVPQPTLVDGSASPEHATLLSALDELLACDHIDAIIRCAVEIARDRVGLDRVAVFLLDEPHGVMRGTWGTDLDGATIDEHHISFNLWPGHEALFEHGARDGIYWTVVENAPIVAHLPAESRVVGRGWLCCTPIRSGLEPIGIMYNDAGLTGSAIDGGKQTQGALLCSLLGTALDLARRRGQSLSHDRIPARSPAVVKATQLLASNPAMTAEELGARLRLSASRMARIFKAELGMSLVEYRNRLRLERFTTLLDKKGDNLLEAALSAGFGSYAQFHRVFLALRGTTPGKFFRTQGDGNDQKPRRQ